MTEPTISTTQPTAASPTTARKITSPTGASPTNASKQDQLIIAGVAKVFKHVDVEALLAITDPKLKQSCTVRPTVVSALAMQCAFVSKSIDSLLKQTRTTRRFQIGIVGCGSVGAAIAEALLRTGWFSPDQLAIVSRHVPTVPWMEAQGVLGFDSVEGMMLKHTPRLVILACLPVHVTQVVRELKQFGKDSLVVCSTVLGMSTAKLEQLLASKNVVRVSVPGAAVEHIRDERLGVRQAANVAVDCMVGIFDVYGHTQTDFLQDEEVDFTRNNKTGRSEEESKKGIHREISKPKLRAATLPPRLLGDKDVGSSSNSVSSSASVSVRHAPTMPARLFASLVNQGTSLGLDRYQACAAALKTLLVGRAGDIAAKNILRRRKSITSQVSTPTTSSMRRKELDSSCGADSSNADQTSVSVGVEGVHDREEKKSQMIIHEREGKSDHSLLEAAADDDDEQEVLLLPWDEISARAFETGVHALLEQVSGTPSQHHHHRSHKNVLVEVGPLETASTADDVSLTDSSTIGVSATLPTGESL